MEKLPDSNDFELIKQLLNDEIDNEDILFTLIDQENLPQLVLRKSLINDCGFNYIRVMLASDLICFLCRSCNGKFSYQITYVLFSLLSNIFVEDVKINDHQNRKMFAYAYMTQQNLVNLLSRILNQLSNEQLKNLKQDFPNDKYLFIWKSITSINIPVTQIDLEVETKIDYDRLFILSKTAKHELLSAVVESFLYSKNNYECLLLLRLIANLRYPIQPKFTLIVFPKLKNLLSNSSQPYVEQFTVKSLQILNSISSTDDAEYQDNSTQKVIVDLISNLHCKCQSNYVLKQYFLLTVVNILSNYKFTYMIQLIPTISEELCVDLKLFVKYISKKCLMDQNDRNIYVDHLRETFLSESLENVDLKFDLTDMNISECIPVISPTKRPIDFSDIIYSNCKRIKVLQELNLNEKQDGNGLVHQLKSLINLANNSWFFN
ncbi:hypothetical protein BLOT_007031 [Blomia tropicalis]|nr:hypothetical protein BLOT_007031 [Blomia tropicalis]